MSDDRGNSPFWPADNPAVMAHVSLLQGIINRLANNSASCKAWCITLVSALVSLAGGTHVPGIVAFALVPITIFGFMDTMYLAQERAYRALFTRTVESVRRGEYRLDHAFEAGAPLSVSGFGAAVLSWSIWPVYFGLIATYVVALRAGWLSALAPLQGG